MMKADEFRQSLSGDSPPPALAVHAEALWWDAKGNWARAHELVNELETPEAMAVHAYLHRKEGEEWNANYWYRRAGEKHRRPKLEEEWSALVDGLVT